MQNEQQTDEAVLKKQKEVRAYQPSIPLSQRLNKLKLNDQFAKFLNIYRKMEITIPFVEALAQTPH